MKSFDPNKYIISHISKEAFDGGICFDERPAGIIVDTLIIHSCYVESDILKDDQKISLLSEKNGKKAALELFKKRKELESDLLKSKSELEKSDIDLLKAYDSRAIRELIITNPEAKLEPFSVAAIKEIYYFYGVSAHFLIDQAGIVYEIVPVEKLAFHAGKSRMPRIEDGRESVNKFSLGVELLASPGTPIKDQQYLALAELTKNLLGTYPLKNFYGHVDIAPGRKTDPEGFSWKKYSGLAALAIDANFPKNL